MTVKTDSVVSSRFPTTRIPQSQLEELVHEFVSKMRHARGTTRHVYEKGLDQLLSFARSNLFRFTPHDFAEFRLWLFNQEKLSRNTVNVYLTASRRFCEFLMEKGILRKNPAWSVHGSAQEFKTLDVKLTEVASAISSIDRESILGKRDFAFLSAIFECGATISEMINANLGDLRRYGNRAKLRVKRTGIPAESDWLSLPPDVTSATYDFIAARGIVSPEEPLFATVRAGRATRVRLSFRGARAAMQKRLSFGNNRRIRLDSLRTYCVVRLMSRGKSSEEVRSIMRFKSNMPFKKIMYSVKSITDRAISSAHE